MLKLWLATSPLPMVAPCPSKPALDGCRHLWRVRAGTTPAACGRWVLRVMQLTWGGEGKLAKPALNWLAWFSSADGESPTTGKKEHGQVTLGGKG